MRRGAKPPIRARRAGFPTPASRLLPRPRAVPTTAASFPPPLSPPALTSLGLPAAATAVAWPSITRFPSIPLSHLGLLLAASMGGYLVSSFLAGTLVSRLGVGTLLFLSTLLVAAALLSYALAAAW